MDNEAKILDSAARRLHDGEGNAEFVGNVQEWAGVVDGATLHSLLPLAVACLLLHEMWTSTQENRAFRVFSVILRIVGCGALLAGYGRLVGLLTGVLGGAGAWPGDAMLTDGLRETVDARMETFAGLSIDEAMDALPHFLLWIVFFMVDCLCAFFAYAVIFLLTKFQALMLIIFISAGKTCIVLSLVPGVGLAKTWARALATLAAWGWMGGLVFSAVGGLDIPVLQYSHSVRIDWHFQIWIFYILLGIFGASIPKLVSMLSSGAVSGAPSILGAMGGVYAGLKLTKMGAKLGAGTARATAGAARLGKRGLGKMDSATGGYGSRALGKMQRINADAGRAIGDASKTAARSGAAAVGRAGDKVIGQPVRSAALSAAVRSGRVGGGATPSSPLSSPVPRFAESPGAVSRAARKQGDWDVSAKEKTPEQWHDEGWRSADTAGPVARPKSKPGYSSHRVTSGWNADGKDQYARWVQVPNKVHGPVQRSSAARGGSQAQSVRAGQVGAQVPTQKTVSSIVRSSAASPQSAPAEPRPSGSEVSSALHREQRADDFHGDGWVSPPEVPPEPTPAKPPMPRRGGKQER